jgi:uncharacterized protein YeaO (DUF488 family)
VASPKLRLRTFRIGAEPRPGEGLRIGATRRPPRGVARARWAAEGYFDVWMPSLAPSEALLRRVRPHEIDDARRFRAFLDAYERELLGSAERRQTVELVAAVARRTPVAIGCYCEDESRCHRARLREILERELSP